MLSIFITKYSFCCPVKDVYFQASPSAFCGLPRLLLHGDEALCCTRALDSACPCELFAAGLASASTSCNGLLLPGCCAGDPPLPQKLSKLLCFLGVGVRHSASSCVAPPLHRVPSSSASMLSAAMPLRIHCNACLAETPADCNQNQPLKPNLQHVAKAATARKA